MSQQPVFVTGATGYIGGRLVPELLRAGHAVRCLAREPRKLDERPWRGDPAVRVVTGDLADVDVLAGQLEGCATAYYLIHSMEASGGRYAERDRLLALHFAQAAARAGLRRVIYLGGLGEMGEGLSDHLRSRREVEERLASTGVPLTTFRAAMIIGAGSASFEILRYLVERLPVMVTPSWVKTESQPVAVTDVLYWLVRCLEVPETVGKTLEIGGPDALPYRDLMQIMAEELHLRKRLIIPLPVLTPRLSSLWISLVTPVSYRIARPLAEGLRNRVVVTNGEAQRLMPHPALGVREAIRQALRSIEAHQVETRWSAAGPIPGDPQWSGGTVFTDQRSVVIQAPPASVYAAVCRIGGGNGWYAGDILWRIRGWMDTLVGGPGLRRGRRHPEQVEFGEALDFWRVVGLERDHSLALLAEMKLPGQALLRFDMAPSEGEKTTLTMTARFRPRGLLGLLYWYAVMPLHDVVFGGMLEGIRKTAEVHHRTEAVRLGPESESPAGSAPRPGYGRSRLWLGISAVGTLVTASAVALAAVTAPGMVGPALEGVPGGAFLGLLAFVLLYALLHLPFDLCGGYLLPRRFGRSHPPLARYLGGLLRGSAVHAALLLLSAVVLMLAGRYGGIAGTVAGGLFLGLGLLAGRTTAASWMAPLEWTPSEPSAAAGNRLPVVLAHSEDEGFTGAVVGVARPRLLLFPLKWKEQLAPEEFTVAVGRRSLAGRTGSWGRGRVLALLFTLVGLALSAWLVGDGRLGTAGGTVELSLWFTLWSFAGLLTLPTWSRAGVLEIDQKLLAEGFPLPVVEKSIRRLDALQDGEQARPALVETIFHPIPSVQHRLAGPRTHGAVGFWDVARTAVYLSMTGLGLLGRAVHCNCGRPGLWVFLPTD